MHRAKAVRVSPQSLPISPNSSSPEPKDAACEVKCVYSIYMIMSEFNANL